MAQKYELLAPAGDFASLRAAVDAGCDAVYFGLKEFSMRAFTENFKVSDLNKIKQICSNKKRKVKTYIALNTIIYDSELKKVENILKKIKTKVDAVICWDLSVINLCRKYKIPFHISTQASVANSKTAEFYKKLGAKRVILARELSLKQIKKIAKNNYVECFIHGALCVSVSGRCFTSQFLFNKSANRGQCLHPCRRAYFIKDEEGNELKLKNNKVMSAKDLCTLPFIEKLKKAGIKSFKIEGRNRSPEYVSTVVSVYKKALNKKLSKKEILQSLKQLEKVYNRGFSPGFYIKTPTSDDFSFSEHGEQTEKKKYIARIEKYWPKAKAAHIKMHASSLKLGDEIYIIGKQTGIKRIKINSMQINKKPIKNAKKGEDIGIQVNQKVRKGDEVYLIIKN